MWLDEKKNLGKGRIKPKKKIKNQTMLTCVISTRIGTNKKSTVIQSHTFPTSVVVGVGSL
jgi:hypothetical protein